MRAIVIEKPGGVEAMQMQTLPDPTPGRLDVVIHVEACGVCFHDIVTRNGTLKAGIRMPLIPGHEIAGTVAAVGPDVRGFKPGDRVATVQRYHICGSCRHCRTGFEPLCEEKLFLGDNGLVGGYAEYVAVEEDNIALIPEGVAADDAAIVACTLGTVYNAMLEVGRVRAGENVLITGASGGLGLMAVQLARLQGARVIAQTTSPRTEPLLRDLGADEVVALPRGEDFSAAVRDLTGGRGADVAVDNVGTPVFTPLRRSLALRARWLLIGQLTGDFVPFNPAQLFIRNISMLSATSTTRQQLVECLGLMARGHVRAVIDDRLPLEQAARAHQRVEAGGVTGRILLKPALKGDGQ